MNVLVSGASGLIGSSLVPLLAANGHEVIRLTRGGVNSEAKANWDPEQGRIHLEKAGAIDAVVHLAGETIAQRWTSAAKRRIRNSRVQGTALLSKAIAERKPPPRMMVCASATGYYGDRGDELLDEQSSSGNGFLADVCREWEAASQAALESDIRVVHVRFGIVLSRRGGALRKMLPIFRAGLGGKAGDGKQYWSWIALEDVLAVVLRTLRDETLTGPVNTVSPVAVRNQDFTKTLGKVLRRPTFFAVPAFMLKLALGQMAEETILASFRVNPARLQNAGFVWKHPELEVALRNTLL